MDHEDINASDYITVPRWIDQNITLADIDAIVQGGCDSGAYIPAVTYHLARDTMGEHGDDVLEYIESALGELPDMKGESWSGIACKYLSTAVELWASSVQDELTAIADEEA